MGSNRKDGLGRGEKEETKREGKAQLGKMQPKIKV